MIIIIKDVKIIPTTLYLFIKFSRSINNDDASPNLS